MNKTDLINELSTVLNTKKEAKSVVECVLSAITKALKKKESVRLIDFGTFKILKRKARTGRNPQTQKPMKIKAKNVPKFVPGKALKGAVK